MNTEAKKVSSFLNKIHGGGDIGPDELKLDFGQSITTSAMNAEKTILVSAEMQPTEFTNYTPLGIVAVDDLKTILGILNGFDKVELSKNGNLLTLSEKGRKVETTLTNPEFIKDAPKKELVFDENIEVEAKRINDFISQAKLNKDFILKISTKPKQLVLETDGKYKFTEVIEAKEAVGGIEVKVGEPFLGMISEFSGKIILKLKSAHPVQLLEQTPTTRICITVAPYIETGPVEQAGGE